MEDRRNGQAPERDERTAADATAARTRPVDAPAATPADAAAARAVSRTAGDEVERMHDRGFGSHKGTEAE